ncbi:hypothetical protein PIB30_018003 [Stylosanthes scabra]|uniref:Uncharacterized protein n=1 Tax=Stylosanthes scabra TaxID=79078 RepID=A0ABU6V5Z9_9FABA|nr:hypothetical protein [Stylosanthes scabra]
MVSGVIYYEYEKREKFEDYDMKANAELGTFKIRRYHFDDESFIHPLYSVRFDPDRSYEIPIEALMVDKYSPRGMPSTQRERLTSSVKGTSSFRHRMASRSLRKPRSWELIPPSKGWMCKGDDKKEIGRMEPSVKKEVSSKEDLEEEEDPEEEEEGSEEEEASEEGIPASSSLPMDMDADEDYLHFIDRCLYAVVSSSPLSKSPLLPSLNQKREERSKRKRDCERGKLAPPRCVAVLEAWHLRALLRRPSWRKLRRRSAPPVRGIGHGGGWFCRHSIRRSAVEFCSAVEVHVAGAHRRCFP